MDTKQLVEKFAKGEISEEQFDTEKAKLTPDQLIELDKEAELQLPTAVEKLKGVRRGTDKIATQNGADESFTKKLKEENLAAAKTKFFSDMGIVTTEDKEAFEKEFKTDSVTPDNILKDMTKHYASINSENYIALLQEKRSRESGAAEFTARDGGSSGSGAPSDAFKKASKEVQDYIRAREKMGKPTTIEQAETALRIARNGGHF